MIRNWVRRRRGKRAVRARHHAALVAPRAGDVRVSASIGPSGEVVALWCAPEDAAELTPTTTSPGGATFPGTRASRPVPARVTVHAPDLAVATRIAALAVGHPSVQPLPDSRILVVGGRCRWRPEGPERNAIVYDADGAVLLEATLGDGIEHVRATRRGDVWVGYFDEGTLGNFGWGEPDGEPPVGARGLVRFSAALTPEWHYPSYDEAAWGGILDCYALNVDGDTAWASYYTGFPVVRIDKGTVTGWHNEVSGATALAVDGTRVALYGGYGPDRHRLTVGVLGADRLEVTGEYVLVRPDGRPLPPTARVIGRGAELHVLTEDAWLRLDIPADGH